MYVEHGEEDAEEGVATPAVARPQRAYPLLRYQDMQPYPAETEGCGLPTGSFNLPVLEPAALRQTPCLRISEFLPAPIAADLRKELSIGLEYERVELGEITRQWRARRPIGNVYFGAMQRNDNWRTPAAVDAALAWFESDAFVSWLSGLAGEPLTFLRPVTAYRMNRGDRLCLHDDMSDPDHAVSVAYNLSRGWPVDWGGETLYGEVTGATPLETPADSPIPLQQLEVANEQRFVPEFNSLLVMRLDRAHAHGVAEVVGDGPRLALVGIYGRLAAKTAVGNAAPTEP